MSFNTSYCIFFESGASQTKTKTNRLHPLCSVNGKTTCVNVYDIRLSDTYPACGMNWPPDLTYITPYLRRDDVRTALHAPGSSSAWTECRGTVGSALSARKSKPSSTLLKGIIERGTKIMLFSGDQDLICNYVGTERLIESLEWQGSTGFNVCFDFYLSPLYFSRDVPDPCRADSDGWNTINRCRLNPSHGP